jgi:uncharacterized protein YrrD
MQELQIQKFLRSGKTLSDLYQRYEIQSTLSEDKSKTNILKISELGLIEMTRKRTHEDLVRYQPLIRFGAKLIGAKVKTINDTKLGTIIDFSFDKTTFDICKLEVRSRWLLMPLAKNLIITRKQIIKIERNVVTVKENTVKNQKAAPELLPVSS